MANFNQVSIEHLTGYRILQIVFIWSTKTKNIGQFFGYFSIIFRKTVKNDVIYEFLDIQALSSIRTPNFKKS
jgi:hypothetical protein